MQSYGIGLFKPIYALTLTCINKKSDKTLEFCEPTVLCSWLLKYPDSRLAIKNIPTDISSNFNWIPLKAVAARQSNLHFL